MIGRVQNHLRSRWRRLEAARHPVILMYHRVTKLDHDPWSLAVTPARFRAQIEHLKTVREVVPLTDLLQPGSRRRAAITFDDGYADIHASARPILHALACPATVFVTTGATEDEREFWWDELTRIVFTPAALPAVLELTIGGATRRWAAPREAGERRGFHDEIWNVLRPLGPSEQRVALDEMARWAGVDLSPRASHRAMTRAELRDLAHSGIAIGAHTVSHPKLSQLSIEAATQEIRASREACEALVDAPVRTFAYPFGDHDDKTVEAVRREGFDLAVTVEPGGVKPRTDPMRLPRLSVPDLDAETFSRWLP